MMEKAMGRTLQEVIESLPAAQRAAVEARAAVLIDEELSLRDLRKKLEFTQVDVARRLKKGQDVVSRIEQRGDLLLSTLTDYIESLGGELELLCRFKDRPPVRIAGVTNGGKDSKRKSAKAIPEPVGRRRAYG